jgi:biopolymer transport protein ExbB
MFEQVELVLAFFQRGGPVIPVLLVVCFLLGFHIIGRYWFVNVQYPKLLQVQTQFFLTLKPVHHWAYEKMKLSAKGQLTIQLQEGVSEIHSLVRIAPLLGLLGTILGMMQVFGSLNLGHTDVEVLSSGISAATLPTLVGLIIGISGYYFHARLREKIRTELQKLSVMEMPHTLGQSL